LKNSSSTKNDNKRIKKTVTKKSDVIFTSENSAETIGRIKINNSLEYLDSTLSFFKNLSKENIENNPIKNESILKARTPSLKIIRNGMPRIDISGDQ